MFSYFKTKAVFEQKLEENIVQSSDICFIEDVQEIWTHGCYYCGSCMIPVINQTETSVVIQPNVYNKWGEVTSLTITFASPTNTNITNEYVLEFISGTTPTSLTLPSNLKYIGGSLPTIEANKTYQISILNNNVVVASFE